MNSDMNDDRLSKHYHSGDRPEPPSALDEKILKAAREAATDKPDRRAAAPFSSRLAPLSVAAVVLITVLLVPGLLREEQSMQKPQEESSMQTPRLEKLTAPESPGTSGETAATHDAVNMSPLTTLRARPEPMESEPATGNSYATNRDSMARRKTSEIGAEGHGMSFRASIPQNETAAVEASNRDPEEWLRLIRRLASGGETELARKELERFLGHHPGHDVEPELYEALGLPLPSPDNSGD